MDDLINIFVSKSLIVKLPPTIDKIPVWWYIIGIPTCSGLAVNVGCLGNWIFVQTKVSIVYSSWTHCVVALFKAKVISTVNEEYQFARFQNTLCNFVEKRNAYNVLCKWENDNIVFNLYHRFKFVIFYI